MSAKNILITGANGQLGNEIKNIAQNYNYFNFIFTDIEELNILDYQAVIKFSERHNIASIINCAAYTAVDKAEEDEKNAYKINVIGTENLKNSAQLRNIPFIHVSTDYVFDGKNFRPYTEDDPTNPQSIYGKTKLEGEKKALNYKKTIIVRTAWLYSTFGNNFVKTILRISEQNDKIKVVFDQVGSPTYAKDLAIALLEINRQILFENNSNFGVYHFANEGVCSWYDFAQQIIKFSKKKCFVEPVKSEEFPRPATRPYYSVLDKTKIKTNFNLKIPYWVDSLNFCLEILLKEDDFQA